MWQKGKTLLLWFFIGLLVLLAYNFFYNQTSLYTSNNISYTEFLEKVEKGEIKEVLIEGQKVSAKVSSSKEIITYIPEDKI
jgi:cell division protease FtsH